ncbi:MAG TPA: DMT family transporter [Rhodocyclaceae bacterium]|nr:DMT family transporter [Rhodocyclaceae bacterium]
MKYSEKNLAIAALFTGAFVWGLIWAPYRALAAVGVNGIWATFASYGVAVLAGLLLSPRRGCELVRELARSPALWPLGIVAGLCNLGYVMGTLYGEVMRVLLLFYLAPLWTVLLARMLLGERIDARGFAVVGLSLAGAAVMLWRPELGLPMPTGLGEWLGLVAGFAFAWSNVLSRKAASSTGDAKALAVCLGVAVCTLPVMPYAPLPAHLPPTWAWLLVVLVGLVLWATNVAVHFGLSRLRAFRAIVIMLSELMVAALASWWLADETMSSQQWAGGAMVITASLLAGRMEGGDPARTREPNDREPSPTSG